jgi:TRAF-type zinc finger
LTCLLQKIQGLRSFHAYYLFGLFTFNSIATVTFFLYFLIGGEIEEHQSICGFEPVACNNNCGMKVTRNRIQAHLTTVCTKRQVTRNRILVHLSTVCTRSQVTRNRIQAHLTTVCTKRQVTRKRILVQLSTVCTKR